jgi:hypothetical protein
MTHAPVDSASLLALLREAAAGRVPDHDLEYAQNPLKWASDFARGLAGGPDAPALSEAIAALLGASRLSEVELGRVLQGATRVAPAEAAWRALRSHVDAGRTPAAILVAQSLAQTTATNPDEPLDAEACALALDPATPDDARSWLMRVIGRADPDWVLSNPDWLLHPDPEVSRRRVADALGGLRSDRMAAQLDRLSALAAARGAPLAPAVIDTVSAMVKARRAAGL